MEGMKIRIQNIIFFLRMLYKDIIFINNVSSIAWQSPRSTLS